MTAGRYKTPTGAVVNLPSEKADTLGYESAEKAPAKAEPKPRAKKES